MSAIKPRADTPARTTATPVAAVEALGNRRRGTGAGVQLRPRPVGPNRWPGTDELVHRLAVELGWTR